MTEQHYSLVIVGGGPAGLTAGLYAARARINHLLIEKGAIGGQVLLTDWIDNYPGFPEGISGFDLIDLMTKQANRFGLNSLTGEVVRIELNPAGKKRLILENGDTITCDSLIISTGARQKHLDIPGEKEFTGKGVSYCGTCDGPFYKNMHIAVVGGGNTAVQEADYLTKFANKVTLIHRRDELRATKIVQEKCFANEKIDFLWNSHIKTIEGKNSVERLLIEDNNGNHSTLDIGGIFIFIGVIPNSGMIESGSLEMKDGGFIVTDNEMRTSVKGVMAAGDIRDKSVRQVINGAGEGATALLAAEEHLASQTT